MGNYYIEEFGPNHTLDYEVSNTTSTEWGYKIGASAGGFTANGRVSMSTQVSQSQGGGSVWQQNGKKTKAVAVIDVQYKRVEYKNCWYMTPPVNPSGGSSIYVLMPHKWLGNVFHFAAEINATPADNGQYTVPILPGSYKYRNNGTTSSSSNAIEVSLAGSYLSGSVSYTTSSSVGSKVRREWRNPTPSGNGVTKYIKGYGGDPLSTVFSVRGYT